uniref:Solute carrier family 22 member 31 n=1 Tax=Cyprinus carpio TaxID=7962 RepID=A0A8C2DE15_CYPCA
MEFETKIYPQIGGYGRYNRIITLFSWFPNFAVSLNLFSDVFFTLIPESYHCKPDLALLPPSSLLGNLSSNYTESVPRDVVPCTRGWEYGKPAGLQNNLVTEVSMLTEQCKQYTQVFRHDLSEIACFVVGVLGRRCVLLLSVLLSGLLGIMSCLSNSPSAFPFFRLCQGSTLAGVFLSSYIARKYSPSFDLCLSMQLIRHKRMSAIHKWFCKVHVYFIGTGIQYCFTRNLHIYSPHFYFSYFLRVLTGALACIFLCVSVDRFGRRGMLLLAAIVTGLSSLLLLALTQYLHGGLVLVLSVVGLLSSQALAMLSVFFGSEVMPTVVRGGTLGLIMAAGCVGMAASSLMELQNNGGYFLHHVIFASFAVLSVLCIMLLPESKHKPLPDSLKDGERQRRPPLFLSRISRDNPPLLPGASHVSHYCSPVTKA